LLSNVRIDRTEKTTVKNGVNITESGALMFFDAHNSSPAGVNFSLSGDIKRQYINYGGKDYRIKQVEYLYDTETLHHLEITLGALTEEIT
jgi:hypothetical protein